MDLTQMLMEIVEHHNNNPTHGTACACMDEHIRELRKATSLTQEYVDLYPGPSKNLWSLQRRIDYVIQASQNHKKVPRKTSECFCCSCADREGSDPFCRNHGWAGERPCEEHKSPGKADDDGVMPISVQKKRKIN